MVKTKHQELINILCDDNGVPDEGMADIVAQIKAAVQGKARHVYDDGYVTEVEWWADGRHHIRGIPRPQE